ncbi:MAG: hypothetical protein DRP92_05770 [Candidatus Neomarinimicrobiota bacterium]|nr:MAG: hypothetical protein DRP92_05770 [Candidatus Neomarinimicrobiota bacterium]
MKRLSLIFALAMVLIVSYFFVWCGKGKMVSGPENPTKVLADYIEKLYDDPLRTVGEVYAKYLIENDEWYDESECKELIKAPESIKNLYLEKFPDLRDIEDILKSKYKDLQVVDATSFRIGRYVYKLEIEMYDNVHKNNKSKLKSIKLDGFGIMVDPDLFNDCGMGYTFVKKDDKVKVLPVTLSKYNILGPLFFVTYRVEDTAELKKPASVHKGTYLVLTGIFLKEDHESGSPEVELYVQGNFSSLVYNKETNFKFDGGDHIDAAGYERAFPDVNKTGIWYPCSNIAICRLTDDFEQKIIYVEDDKYPGRFAHDDNDSGIYDDYVRKVDILKGYYLLGYSPYFSGYEGVESYMLISHNNPDNNDDVDQRSEVSHILKSTVPTTEVMIGNDSIYDKTYGICYRIKKVTYD